MDDASEEANIENTSELQKTVIMNVLLSAYPDLLKWVAGVSDCSNAVSKQAHDIIMPFVREVGKESKEAAAFDTCPVLRSCMLINPPNDKRDNLRSLNGEAPRSGERRGLSEADTYKQRAFESCGSRKPSPRSYIPAS